MFIRTFLGKIRTITDRGNEKNSGAKTQNKQKAYTENIHNIESRLTDKL